MERHTTGRDAMTTTTNTPPTLDALLDALRSGEIELDDSLPTYGGDEPRGTDLVWSWDESRLLVGTHVGEPGEMGALQLVDRI